MKENKIPSAEEFINRETLLKYFNDENPFITDMLIKFAKIHVKAALETALEESLWVANIEGVDYDDIADSILSAYPEELIK